MSESDFNQFVATLSDLSVEQLRSLRLEVDAKLAPRASLAGGGTQGSLGAMRDAADELNAIVEQAMKNRRERPWLPPTGE